MTLTAERQRRPRVENATRRRQQLLDATAESIVKHGLGATTLATVAHEAGLSQGLAIFYFKTKQALIEEVLRANYAQYRTVWQAALANAGSDPIERILSMVRADFDPSICNRTKLAVWHAFWGEANERAMFAAVSTEFDRERERSLRQACVEAGEFLDTSCWTPRTVALSVDMLTDGLWHRMHIAPDQINAAGALDLALRHLAMAFKGRRDEILATRV